MNENLAADRQRGLSFSESYLLIRLIVFPPAIFTPVGKPQQTRAEDHGDAAIDRPLRITGHEAARQDIDPLQEPYAARQM